LNLREFDLLADENIPLAVIEYLIAEGFSVLDVKRSPLVGSTDRELIEHALAHNLVVLTHDPDFGAIAAAGFQSYIGIVFLRPGHIDPNSTIASVKALMEKSIDLRPPFLVVVSNRASKIRIRVRQ
jgi:predicted nuclease of predicted toxin-antitoxin system